MKEVIDMEKNPRFATEHPSRASRAERKAAGKALRSRVPLQSQKQLHIPKSGRDVIEVLEQSNEGRVTELVPIRYSRMLVSPFTFYRGSAGLMALDLANTPNSGLIVQACGDCHIQNFGAYGTPERKLLVDINDFDETLPAPWEWDVKRLAASLVLAASANELPSDVGLEAALRAGQAYRQHIDALSEMSIMEAWYSHVQASAVVNLASSETRKRIQKMLPEAIAKSSPEFMMEKLTVTASGRLRFKDMPPLLCHVEGISAGEQERQAFEAYRTSLADDRRVLLDKFEMVDIARKVVGIGSVGTMCGVILLASSEQDILVLQIKEARKSVLEPYAGASKYDHHGQRVVNGQKLMQAASDIFLGWTTGPRSPYRHFYLRQLRDIKIGVNTALWNREDFKLFPEVAGQILARAHARSGDAAMLRGYLGKSEAFEDAIAQYAGAYARQTERDYHQFVKACKTGRLVVQME